MADLLVLSNGSTHSNSLLVLSNGSTHGVCGWRTRGALKMRRTVH